MSAQDYLKDLSKEVSNGLDALTFKDEPAQLYDPLRYTLKAGGKRLRPLLVLLGYKIFSGKESLPIQAAMAIEVFHNFTLLHDDVMDDAPLRRHAPTVHAKWGVPTAILSGDVMLVEAYSLLTKAEPRYLKDSLDLFNEGAKGVCEGQMFDMHYGTGVPVSQEEYINMIRHKTALLLGVSLKLGALLAGATIENQESIYDIGIALGISFQIQDDLLDAFSEGNMGKRRGGDIIEGKKTILTILAHEQANEEERTLLASYLETSSQIEPELRVDKVLSMFGKLGIEARVKGERDKYFEEATTHIRNLKWVDEEAKQALLYLSQSLLERQA